MSWERGLYRPRELLAQRRCEADLLRGVMILDHHARSGDVVAASELAKIMPLVEPGDFLTPSARALWCAARSLYTAGSALSRNALLATASRWFDAASVSCTLTEFMEYGLWTGWFARREAKRLLRMSAARRRYKAALEEAAAAISEIRDGLASVFALDDWQWPA